jgi:hypothetical protein
MHKGLGTYVILYLPFKLIFAVQRRPEISNLAVQTVNKNIGNIRESNTKILLLVAVSYAPSTQFTSCKKGNMFMALLSHWRRC